MKSLYSSNYNLEFYHIPKNAMTSVINWTHVVWTDSNKIPDSRITICVLRDPIERAVSSYLQIRNHYVRNNFSFSFRELKRKKFNQIFLNFNPERGFDQYLTELLENGYFDSHNFPQYYYLCDKHKMEFGNDWINDRSIESIDHFIDIKNIKSELSSIIEDVEFTHEKLNVEKSYFKKWLMNYSVLKINEIRALYSIDFELQEKYISKIERKMHRPTYSDQIIFKLNCVIVAIKLRFILFYSKVGI